MNLTNQKKERSGCYCCGVLNLKGGRRRSVDIKFLKEKRERPFHFLGKRGEGDQHQKAGGN